MVSMHIHQILENVHCTSTAHFCTNVLPRRQSPVSSRSSDFVDPALVPCKNAIITKTTKHNHNPTPLASSSLLLISATSASYIPSISSASPSSPLYLNNAAFFSRQDRMPSTSSTRSYAVVTELSACVVLRVMCGNRMSHVIVIGE